MTTFAEALFRGMTDPDFIRRRKRQRSEFGYVIGDGTAVCLGDRVRIPERVGGLRAGVTADVVALFDDGLGLRFGAAEGGIRREMFEWVELDGASASGFDRSRKRKSVMPPKTR